MNIIFVHACSLSNLLHLFHHTNFRRSQDTIGQHISRLYYLAHCAGCLLWVGIFKESIVFVGIDLAKNVFALHGVDEAGKAALVRPVVRRDQLLEAVAKLRPCTTGMEASE